MISIYRYIFFNKAPLSTSRSQAADAKAAMMLYKSVRKEWESSLRTKFSKEKAPAAPVQPAGAEASNKDE